MKKVNGRKKNVQAGNARPYPGGNSSGCIRDKGKGFRRQVKGRWMFCTYAAIVLSCCFAVPCYAANDPIAVVNNLSNFIFGLVRAIGMIMLGFGIVQIGLSLKSHDPSQRANGFMTLAGGAVITFAKEILTLITG